MRKSSERGLTFVTVLFVLAAAAGIYWIIVFGTVYYGNHEIKSILRGAGNTAYQQKDDKVIRLTIERQLCDDFGGEGEVTAPDGHKSRKLLIDFQPEDLTIVRTASPPSIAIELRYSRTINLPIFGGQRTLYFDDHIDQELSVVKW